MTWKLFIHISSLMSRSKLLWPSRTVKPSTMGFSLIWSCCSGRAPHVTKPRAAHLMSHSSWKDRISFTLLFGIATSVELFEARLSKSTSQCLYGAQFDVVQMSSILESVFKCAVAHQACPLKLGPGILNGLIERQQSQVAGIQVFISSLKVSQRAASCTTTILSQSEG